MYLASEPDQCVNVTPCCCTSVCFLVVFGMHLWQPGARGETIRSPLKVIDGGDHRKSWGTSVFDCCAVICALLLCCQPFQVASICALYKTEQMGVSHLFAKSSALTWMNTFIWSRLLQAYTQPKYLQLICCVYSSMIYRGYMYRF